MWKSWNCAEWRQEMVVFIFQQYVHGMWSDTVIYTTNPMYIIISYNYIHVQLCGIQPPATNIETRKIQQTRDWRKSYIPILSCSFRIRCTSPLGRETYDLRSDPVWWSLDVAETNSSALPTMWRLCTGDISPQPSRAVGKLPKGYG